MCATQERQLSQTHCATTVLRLNWSRRTNCSWKC